MIRTVVKKVLPYDQTNDIYKTTMLYNLTKFMKQYIKPFYNILLTDNQDARCATHFSPLPSHITIVEMDIDRYNKQKEKTKKYRNVTNLNGDFFQCALESNSQYNIIYADLNQTLRFTKDKLCDLVQMNILKRLDKFILCVVSPKRMGKKGITFNGELNKFMNKLQSIMDEYNYSFKSLLDENDKHYGAPKLGRACMYQDIFLICKQD